MTVAPSPSFIREIVARTFGELAADGSYPADLSERILIDDGDYVARSFRWDDYFAMWLIDVGILQFYDDEGNMLRTVNLLEEWEPRQKAA